MEKIAIISDIHSNLTALDAVLKDIAKRRIKRIVCLGDLVGKGPQPVACIDRVRDKCEIVLQGNWDDGIGAEQNNPNDAWQQEQIGAERIRYLAELPFSYDLLMSGKLIRMFHASPESVYIRVKRKDPKEAKLGLFANTPRTGTPEDGRTPDIVLYGDVHTPYMQTFKSRGLTLWNVGSVGVPYDGIPMPSYVIIEGTPGDLPAPISVQHVRVPYDIEQAVLAAQQSGMPMPGQERFIAEIRTAISHK
ncbi:metallophosphoesterase family protein [Paenibacillus chartarius]|uniref:Metallophosphoesterase family protein n=1 Tax=Paenibacillus chartarius TaxID=747481 RepID=A0ABV6DUM5_9BACL